jgi:hypothetical protein
MDKHLNDSYKLRIPAELKAKVAESAKAHNRSMNADIVSRLEQSFGQRNFVFSKGFESLIPFLEPLLKEVAQTNQRSLEDEVADRIFKSFTMHGAEEALMNASTEDLFKELTRRMRQ